MDINSLETNFSFLILIKLFKNRSSYLLAFFIDLLIVNFIIFSNIDFSFSYTNYLIVNVIAIIWIFVSYLNDRYLFIWPNNNIFKLIKTQFLNDFITFLIISFIYFPISISFDIETEFNSISLILRILCASTFFQIIYSSIINSRKTFKNKWYFIGKEKTFKKLKKILKFSKKNITIELVDYKNFEYLEINKLKTKGLVLENLQQLKQEFPEKIFSLKSQIKIYSPLKWFELEIECIPSIGLNDFYIKNILFKNYLFDNVVKRIAEFFLSFLILIFTTPIILISSLLIYLEDRGPIFYFQTRHGYKLKEIKIIKLRTMRVDAENAGIRWSSKYDQRVTYIGRYLRKFRFDELPQLINVLKGDMSLIGPRPERPELDEFLLKNIQYYSYRYQMKPGLSGWAQVCYPYGASEEDAKNKFSYDLFYIKNFSIIFDLLIMLKTMRIVFNARGSLPNSQD